MLWVTRSKQAFKGCLLRSFFCGCGGLAQRCAAFWDRDGPAGAYRLFSADRTGLLSSGGARSAVNSFRWLCCGDPARRSHGKGSFFVPAAALCGACQPCRLGMGTKPSLCPCGELPCGMRFPGKFRARKRSFKKPAVRADRKIRLRDPSCSGVRRFLSVSGFPDCLAESNNEGGVKTSKRVFHAVFCKMPKGGNWERGYAGFSGKVFRRSFFGTEGAARVSAGCAVFWRYTAPDCTSGRLAGAASAAGGEEPKDAFSPDVRCRAAASLG